MTAQPIPLDASYGTLNTHTEFVLPVVGIDFASLSLLVVLVGTVAMLVTGTPREKPLAVFRVTYFTTPVAALALTISSAKITARADRLAGTTSIRPDELVRAWMDEGFYAPAWVATVFLWVCNGLSIFVGLKIQRILEIEKK